MVVEALTFMPSRRWYPRPQCSARSLIPPWNCAYFVSWSFLLLHFSMCFRLLILSFQLSPSFRKGWSRDELIPHRYLCPRSVFSCLLTPSPTHVPPPPDCRAKKKGFNLQNALRVPPYQVRVPPRSLEDPSLREPQDLAAGTLKNLPKPVLITKINKKIRKNVLDWAEN